MGVLGREIGDDFRLGWGVSSLEGVKSLQDDLYFKFLGTLFPLGGVCGVKIVIGKSFHAEEKMSNFFRASL